jgi:hypothetical protein
LYGYRGLVVGNLTAKDRPIGNPYKVDHMYCQEIKPVQSGTWRELARLNGYTEEQIEEVA